MTACRICSKSYLWFCLKRNLFGNLRFLATFRVVGPDRSILLLLVFQSQTAVLTILMCSLLGTGLASSNYWALTQAISPEKLVGRVTGYQNSIASLAGLSAPVITGVIVEKTKSFDIAIFFAGASLLVGLAAYILLLRESDIARFRERFSVG